MAVTEAQSAEVDPKVREIIADLMRRVGELEKQNGATERRHAEDATVLAKIDAQIPFLATKAELADFRTEALTEIAKIDKKLEVGFANIMTVIAKMETLIAKMETQNERNSKNSIKWNVGIGVALIGVIATATGIILAALPS